MYTIPLKNEPIPFREFTSKIFEFGSDVLDYGLIDVLWFDENYIPIVDDNPTPNNQKRETITVKKVIDNMQHEINQLQDIIKKLVSENDCKGRTTIRRVSENIHNELFYND